MLFKPTANYYKFTGFQPDEIKFVIKLVIKLVTKLVDANFLWSANLHLY